MHIATLEHVNITVSDPKETAAKLCRIFGWHIRWDGASKDNGYTVHVGSESSYVALYASGQPQRSEQPSYQMRAGLNHIALVVEDLDAVEARVLKEGFRPTHHSDYTPGRRFYFRDRDDVEYEVVSYAAADKKGSKQKHMRTRFMKELGTLSFFGSRMK